MAFVAGNLNPTDVADGLPSDSSKGRIMIQSLKKDGTGSVTINAGTSNSILGFMATDTDISDSEGRTDIELWIDQFPYVDVENNGTVSIEAMA